MADQPENPQEIPGSAAEQGESRPSATPPTGSQPGENAGWHTPPPTGAVRPTSETWFRPAGAADVTPEGDAPQPVLPDVSVGASPIEAGGWFTPIDSDLDKLLSRASETIAGPLPGQPAPQQAWSPPTSGDTQSISADTDILTPAELPAAASDEEQETLVLGSQEQPAAGQPAAADPFAPDTMISAGEVADTSFTGSRLTPAEAAFLAEQNAKAAQASTEPSPQEDTSISTDTPSAGTPVVPSPQMAGKTPAASIGPTPFEVVERKVQVLRQRYEAGHLTRDELQNELRSLMILDDDGHWWMLGLESNKWYRYDGQTWVEAIPPGHTAPVRGSSVSTNTDMQRVVIDDFAAEDEMPVRPAYEVPIEVDDSPLPQRVPQEDPGATLVSPNSPFLEPVRRSEAMTLQQASHVYGGQAVQGDAGATIATSPVGGPAGATMVNAAVPAAPVKPKPPLGQFPQPDYSAAYGARRGNPWVRWSIRFAVFGLIGGMAITLLALLGMVAYYFYQVNQYTSAVDSLHERASTFETTLILDSDGTKLAEFSDPKTGPRQEVPLNQISPWLIHATIATENETFYTDPGFSVLAIVRAAYQNVQEGDTVSGASTITQQLARALVLETEFASQRTTERKIVEVIVASEIKRKYSKNEILEIYLNEIFYGNRAYGIQAAAQTYFGKSAADLNPAEAAFLAGLPQSPATYDPVINREAALARMDTVLRLMSEANGNGCITIQHTDATRWGVPNGGTLCVTAEVQPDGQTLYYYQAPGMAERAEMVLDIAYVKATTFRMPVTEMRHPHFVNYVWQQLEQTYGPQAIYAAGFRVTTTLNERIQQATEQAVTNNLNRVRNQGYDVENASVVVERVTDGAILAMVGSADYYNEDIDGQVNVALTAQQSGSAITPLVYLTALTPDEQNNYWTPATVIWDVYTAYTNPTYVPVNFDGLYHGPKTLRESLANSLNVPAVKTLDHVGLLRFTETAQKVGLNFPFGNPIEIGAGLPTALGAVDVRLFDMVTAFNTLANMGRRISPYTIVHIEDSKGNTIFDVDPNRPGEQVIQPELAYLVTHILSDNVARTQEFNPGWPMELSNGRPAAIKTGTSNDSRDLWAMGYTPQVVVGVWVGNTDNRPIYGLFGSSIAAPIWNEVMEAAHQGLPIVPFTRPAGIIEMAVCTATGAQMSADCPGGSHQEIFANFAPPPTADRSMFVTLQVDRYTGLLVNEYCPNDVETRTFLNLSDPTAANWINTTPEGQAWAANLGITLPVQSPPTAYCDPTQPRPSVIITYPPQDMIISSEARVLPIRGQVVMPNFSRYEISYAYGHNVGDQAFSAPVLVEQTQWTAPDSILGQVDTSNLQNGPYTLRLTVYDTQGRRVTQDVRITVNNPAVPMPSPTFAPTLTPGLPPTPTLEPTPG